MSEDQLDLLPEGVIQVDRMGKILYYSPAQAMLSQREVGATIGLNFFTDVAPCTAVKDFQGRFLDFVDQPVPRKGYSHISEPFLFDLRFSWGVQRGAITFAKSSLAAPRIYIVIRTH